MVELISQHELDPDERVQVALQLERERLIDEVDQAKFGLVEKRRRLIYSVGLRTLACLLFFWLRHLQPALLYLWILAIPLAFTPLLNDWRKIRKAAAELASWEGVLSEVELPRR